MIFLEELELVTPLFPVDFPDWKRHPGFYWRLKDGNLNPVTICEVKCCPVVCGVMNVSFSSINPDPTEEILRKVIPNFLLGPHFAWWVAENAWVRQRIFSLTKARVIAFLGVVFVQEEGEWMHRCITVNRHGRVGLIPVPCVINQGIPIAIGKPLV